ncbi:MAG: hypothetical protein ACRETU_01415 [Steroidobacterales bacterium]
MTDSNGRDADAIRYVVLRKLASGLRHTLMGELQTIQFSAELAARMLGSTPGHPKLEECIRQMPDQTRTAVNSCRSLIEWLRPEDKATITVDEALRQCLRVAGDDWSLRGIQASTEVRTGGTLVAKPALRELLVTALFVLTDTHPGPIDIQILAETTGDEVIVTLRAKEASRTSPFPPLMLYRALSYDDIVTLGGTHGAECTGADDAVTLRLRALPATP